MPLAQLARRPARSRARAGGAAQFFPSGARSRNIPVFHIDIQLYTIGSTDRQTYMKKEWRSRLCGARSGSPQLFRFFEICQTFSLHCNHLKHPAQCFQTLNIIVVALTSLKISVLPNLTTVIITTDCVNNG